MKAKEFLIENNKVPSTKPRNPVMAGNNPGRGTVKHADKKKDLKQGKVKHKKDALTTEAYDWENSNDIPALEKRLKELEKRESELYTAVSQAREITKSIKYEQTHMDIISQLSVLADKYKLDKKQLDFDYYVNDVYEKFNELMSAVYGLDDIFTQHYKDVKSEVDELEYTIDDIKDELRRSQG
jgi:hypothetical protein